MSCTIFVRAANHIDEAANLGADEFFTKLRSLSLLSSQLSCE